MRRGDMADQGHPKASSPMIPLQVAPIADQAFETALFSLTQKHSTIAYWPLQPRFPPFPTFLHPLTKHPPPH